MKGNVHLWYELIDFLKEDYDRLRPLSFLGTDIVLVAFAVVSPDSFANVEEKWFPIVYHFLKNVPRILVGIQSGISPCCPRNIVFIDT